MSGRFLTVCGVSLFLSGCQLGAGLPTPSGSAQLMSPLPPAQSGSVLPISLTPERTLLGLRATHANVCGWVLDAHDAGLLTGARFNAFKAACIESDAQLDQADALLASGLVDGALSVGQAAVKLLAVIPSPAGQ